MYCKHCPALVEPYNIYEEEEYCALYEDEREFLNGEVGCLRRSVKKIESDLKNRWSKQAREYAEECEKFTNYMESLDS